MCLRQCLFVLLLLNYCLSSREFNDEKLTLTAKYDAIASNFQGLAALKHSISVKKLNSVAICSQCGSVLAAKNAASTATRSVEMWQDVGIADHRI